MSERHLTITNGRIVRPGFYRSADGSGQEYAKAVSTGMLDKNCVFCPERMKSRGDDVLRRVGSKAWSFFVIHARPAYAHFDAQQVLEHRMIIPEAHIESEYDIPPEALALRDEYIHDEEIHAAPGTAVQSYTRSANSPSKSISHLHTHLFTLSASPLAEFEYTMVDGVKKATFIEPTAEQIDAIEQSRHHL